MYYIIIYKIYFIKIILLKFKYRVFINYRLYPTRNFSSKVHMVQYTLLSRNIVYGVEESSLKSEKLSYY